MIVKNIIYCLQKVVFICDGNCKKAWGINNRPRTQLAEEDDDDMFYHADNEVEDAPANPGTYEGGEAKPTTDEEKPNKWCVRECERSSILPGEHKDFSKRRYNKPWLHPQAYF